MKKILLFVLPLLIAAGLFTACSVDTLGMINLMNEKSTVKSGEISGSVSFTLNGEAIAKLYESEYGDEFFELPFQELTLEYNGEFNSNPDAFTYYLEFALSFDGDKTDLGSIVINDENVYISSATFTGVLELLSKIDPSMDEFSAELWDALVPALEGYEYIEIFDPEEYAYLFPADGDQSTALLSLLGVGGIDGGEFQDILVSYITDIFTNFDFGAVKREDDTYTLSMNLRDVFDGITDAVQYLSDNQDAFFNATEGLIRRIFDLVSSDLFLSDEDLDMVIDEMYASQEDFAESLEYLKEMLDFAEFADFEKSNFTYSIGKDGDAYSEKLDLNFVYGDDTLFSLSVEETVTAKEIGRISVEGAMPYDEFYEFAGPILEEVFWYLGSGGSDYDYNYGYFYMFAEAPDDRQAVICAASYGIYSSANGSSYNDEDVQIYLMDGELYLPLRTIAEAFGDEVYWDAKTKKAYVVRGDEMIDMTGILVNNQTMVNVYDFYKLDYDVVFDHWSDDDYDIIYVSLQYFL